MGFGFYSMVCAFKMLKVTVMQIPCHYLINGFQGKASQFSLRLYNGHNCCLFTKYIISNALSYGLLNFLRYSGVFALVTRFLNQAEKESPKAAAVMFLGAAKEIALHKDPAL